MNILTFAFSYKRLVLFGISLTFFSSFGQTFFISLFVPGFLETFGISNAYFGTVYSIATLSSAFILAWVGAKIDRILLKKYALFVTGGLALSTLAIFASQWIWMLFLGLIGIRLFGQGLSSHTAQTTMGRYFFTMRGKALSLSSLGYTIGEALLPITITTVIAAYGWRAGWAGSGLFILLVLPAIIMLTLGKDPALLGEKKSRKALQDDEKEPAQAWRRTGVLRDYRFYLILPSVIVSPFLLTGLFLYQTQLAQFKGWEIEVLASAFIAFAVARSAFSLISGPLIDRFKAGRLFPFFLIPFFIGLLIVNVSSHVIIPFLYLFFTGMSEGFGGNIKTAIFAEMYGTANLGAIRSMMTMFMVISSAVSPILFGFLLDYGVTFDLIIYGSMGIMLISMLLGSFIFREAKRTIS